MNNYNKKYKAVVTGSTRGIGFAIAKKLLSDGMTVITTGKTKTSKHPEGSIYKKVNFLDDISTKEFVNYLKKEKVDILVNNAGINKIGKFTEVSISDFDKILKVNLRAPFILCQAVLPHMLNNHWGRIVNISSIWGKISREHRASYSASKFGIDGMTASLSAEYAQYGILSNSVGPGFISTDLTKKTLGEKGIKDISKQIPIKRLGQPDEIASLVSWLVSESNTYLSGQNILIDGGFTRV